MIDWAERRCVFNDYLMVMSIRSQRDSVMFLLCSGLLLIRQNEYCESHLAYASRRLEELPVNTQRHKFPKLCPNTSLTHTCESENGCWFHSQLQASLSEEIFSSKHYLLMAAIIPYWHPSTYSNRMISCHLAQVFDATYFSKFEFADLYTVEFWVNNNIQ